MDGNDPENLEYIITLGIDVAEDGYGFTFVPAKTQSAETKLLSATGKTLAEGVSFLDRENPRKTEMGQLKMIVLSKEVLEDDDYLTLLGEWERSQDISGNVMLLATENTAEECLQAILDGDGETGLFLWDFYENTAEDVAVTWGEDLDGFLTALGEQKEFAILPKISVTDGKLSLGGGLLLANHQYIETLHTEDTLGYAFLGGNGEGAVLVASNGTQIPVSLRVMKNNVSYEVDAIGDAVRCTISVVVKGDILGSGGQELFDENTSDTLEDLFAKLIKEEVEHTIEVAKNVDALESLGIGMEIRRKQPNFSVGEMELQLLVEVEVELEDFGRIR